MPLLSIIIPVYKVEKYVDKCINSILQQRQELLDYEVIVVNDGTPDRSMNIVHGLVEGNSHFKLIDEDNQGLSQARNNGLRNASGKYVWFVDSDDYIVSDAFEILAEILDKDEVQIYAFNLCVIDENTEKTETWWSVYKRYQKSYYQKEMTGIQLQRKISMTPIQRFIYRHDFLRNYGLSFYPHIYHEDAEFSLRANFFADSIICYNISLYVYLKRDSGSITSHYNIKNIESIWTICHLQQEFLKTASQKQGGKQMINDDLFDLCVSLRSSRFRDVEGYHSFIHKYGKKLNRLALQSFIKSMPQYFTFGKLYRLLLYIIQSL